MPNPFFDTPRTRRLKRDLDEMKLLREQSSILEFEASGPSPDKYNVIFHGLGLDASGKKIDEHHLVVTLGMGYPAQPPEVNWKTPILHPNINGGRPCFGTFIMNPNVRLVDIMEILWDMGRLAIYNPYHGGGGWDKIRKTVELPVDKRILRDKNPVNPAPEEDSDEPDLIIMSGAARKSVRNHDWAEKAISQYLYQAGLSEHALVYNGTDWSFAGHDTGKGSVATMVVDRYLYEKLRVDDDETQAFLDHFITFISQLGLDWKDGVPGTVHFYQRR